MKHRRNLASLEARDTPLRTAALRAMLPIGSDGVQVDREAGIIRNVAVMTIGPAKGHGFEIDSESLQQTFDLLSALGAAGAKVRFTHPKMTSDDDGHISKPDDLLSLVGSLRNPRLEGNSVRGDVHLGAYAKHLPGLGDVWSYLLDLAEHSPERIGMSAVIAFEPVVLRDAGKERIVARVDGLEAVDFVGEPAANPNGLLSTKEPTTQTPEPEVKGTPMDPKMKSMLVDNYGLKPDATDEEALSFLGMMTDDKKAELTAKLAEVPAADPEPEPTPEPKEAAMAVQIDSDAQYVALEGKRVANIRALAKTLPDIDDATVSLAIAEGDDAKAAGKRFCKTLADKARPVAGAKSTADLRVGDDRARTAYLTAIPQAIQLRAGIEVKDQHELAGKLRYVPLIDQYRHMLVSLGANYNEVGMISRPDMARLIMHPRNIGRRFAALAHSTADFDNLLADTMNKTLRNAYQETPVTWNIWAARDVLADFKPGKFITLSEIPDLSEKKEGAEIKYTTMSDGKEEITLVTYANGIRLTAEAIINDDLRAFGRVPAAQGAAARRKEDDVAYAILTANAALSDSGLLFNSTAVTTATGHANLVSGSANVGAPSVATVSAAEKLMLLQKGPKNAAYLNIMPKFMLVPVSIKTAAETFIASRVDPSKSNEYPNPYQGKLQVIPNARLDANSTTAFYLAADYRDGVVDTVVVCFLTDQPEPVLKQETEFDTEDVKFAVKHTVAAKAIDFRGLAKNPGA